MTDIFDEITIKGEGVTPDRPLWKRDRGYTPGLFEKTLDANPGLAALGVFPPVGTVIKYPHRSEEQQFTEVIRLVD